MPDYLEKLWPTPWIYIASAMLIPGSTLVLAPVSMPAGIVTGVVLYLALVGSLAITTPVIEVQGGRLRAGRAEIALDDIGEATPADEEQARVERGTGLDARAFLVIRGWIKPVVRVPVVDPADPTPYWLISTRRPKELAAAINRSRRPDVQESGA